MDRIDLHIHSVYSDGTLRPKEIVERAKLKGLRAISITDHDTVDGLLEGESAAALAGIEFLHGCEISAYYNDLQTHILGYYIDPRSKTLAAKFKELAVHRDERNQDMIDALAQIGINLSHEQLAQVADGDIITRSHFAKALWVGGYADSISDAFYKYISPGCPGYVPHEALTAVDCIEFIRGEGGVPVLAHPFLYKMDDTQLERFVKTLVDSGLMGIEAVYSTHTHAQTQTARKWANKYRLVATGGSDFHGDNRPTADLGVGRGSLFVPYCIVDELRQAKESLPITCAKTLYQSPECL